MDLAELWPVLALSATVTDDALPVGQLRADNVAAVVVVHEADALTGAALGTAAHAYFVDLAALAAARDQPLAGAEVLEIFAVQLEESVSAKDVRWLWFGGGFLPGTGYSFLDQGTFLLGPRLGGSVAKLPAGASSFDACIISKRHAEVYSFSAYLQEIY